MPTLLQLRALTRDAAKSLMELEILTARCLDVPTDKITKETVMEASIAAVIGAMQSVKSLEDLDLERHETDDDEQRENDSRTETTA